MGSKRHRFPSTSMQDSILKVPVLPEELIFEILSRLPVKPLLKFRCVSKSWLALISSPEFIKTHLSLSADNKDYTRHWHFMLSFDRPKYNLKECSLSSSVSGLFTEAYDLYFPLKNQSKIIWVVVGSINGLVCFSDPENNLFLWNPSTREYKKLPNFGTDLRYADHSRYGFGYDELHDDYKVVGFIYCSRNWSLNEVKIYSLKDDSWRSVHPPMDGLGVYGSGKFVNGKLHWANHTTGVVFDRFWNIISLDLADGKWEKVDKPCNGEEGGVLVLGVLGNNLCAINGGVLSKDSHLGTDINVWVMKKYLVKESWTKMFTVKYPHCPVSMVAETAFLIPNKDEILLVFGGKFFLYNLKDESITYPKIPVFGFGVDSVVTTYLGSLVSPVLQNGPRTQQEWGVRKLKRTQLCKQ
ncbi:hypothetical protein HAX54_032311 [Datura stramonium]|uniref:F-box domain-containing protein n=1 Tax=Datura stramonium TaxID=4076 RepID=A0ABS8SCK6_DATST|nr:hypothetical protein [Datura stramonium]